MHKSCHSDILLLSLVVDSFFTETGTLLIRFVWFRSFSADFQLGHNRSLTYFRFNYIESGAQLWHKKRCQNYALSKSKTILLNWLYIGIYNYTILSQAFSCVNFWRTVIIVERDERDFINSADRIKIYEVYDVLISQFQLLRYTKYW